MNDRLFNKINQKVVKIFNQYDIEYETEGDEEDRYNDVNYIIIIKNSKTALQTLVQLRNRIMNDKELSIYEFLEEQVSDQMADNDEYLTVDFYIGLKGDNMILEIENYDGNTMAVVSLSVKDGRIEIDNTLGVDVADVEDYDDYFGTTDSTTRIQLNYKGSCLEDRPMCGHYDGSICVNMQSGSYGHDCDCPDDCSYYEWE